MAELFIPPGVHQSLLGPSLSLGWPAEPITCSPLLLPVNLHGLRLEFVVRGLGPALAGKDLGSGDPVGANKGSGCTGMLCPAGGPTTSWGSSGRVSREAHLAEQTHCSEAAAVGLACRR